jgi:hypothetical protein
VSGDAVTLARELVGRPRFPRPWWLRPDGTASYVPRDNPHRDCADGPADGMLWRQDPDDLRRWFPVVADGPTAGALLLALGPALRAVHRGERETGPVWWVVFDGPDGRTHATLHCPTLGEAVARALLDLWSQP